MRHDFNTCTEPDGLTLEAALGRARHIESTTEHDAVAVYCEKHRGWHVEAIELAVGEWDASQLRPMPAPKLELVEAEIGEFRLADTFARVTSVAALALALAAVLIR